MLSLVSVYNNEAKLEARLRAGLARQKAQHELICIDNRQGAFSGAAAALNHGASKARGDFVVFLHQDVELLGPDWLEKAESYLRSLDPHGWHGVVGRTAAGRWRGLLRDRDMVFGEPFSQPVEVQTLDEIALIHRNRGPEARYFDEGLGGWHAYGVEACCQALRGGARNTVLPLPVFHDSPSSNQARLRDAHAYVWAKHKSAFRRIYTTCGVLPHPYGWSGSYKISTFLTWLSGFRYAPWLLKAGTTHLEASPFEILDRLTSADPVIHCYHQPFDLAVLEGVGFVDRTPTRRSVVHHFTGLPAGPLTGDCHVIMPDLASQIDDRHSLSARGGRLIVATHLEPTTPGPTAWRRRLKAPLAVHLATEPGGTHWAILDCRPPSGFAGQAAR